MNKIIYILLVLFLTSCADKVSESQIAAQVGNSVLTVNEVKMKVPLALSGIDSLAFVSKYIDEWINEHMLYEQGLRNLPNIEDLNQQVEDYRLNLISQSYENEILNQYMSSEITETECQEFYDKHSQQIRLEYPIIQGVYVKLLLNSSKVKDVKRWLEQLNNGKTDCIEEFDQYGTQRAAEYDNYFDSWVSMYRLSDKLPATVIDPALFLKRKTYELKDDTYYYLFVIKDFRLAGEIAPYDYAKSDVYEMLVNRKRKDIRAKLLKDLKEDGLESGFVKINK
ncbi:MAG: hypothetical protein HUJ97_01175 [Bacteroidales bacterium]|nr:hypothetical protein [Bacteroidales bacterium]